MKNPLGRDETVALAANGNPYAQAFLRDFLAFCDVADDIEDEERLSGRSETLLHLMVDMMVNPFFRLNSEALSAHIRAATVSWAASNHFGGPEAVRQKYAGSCWQILGYVAFLCGGRDKARQAVSMWIDKCEGVSDGMV